MDQGQACIKYTRTREEAIAFLKTRYAEQLAKFPKLAEIPLALYVKRNTKAAMTYYRKRAEEG